MADASLLVHWTYCSDGGSSFNYTCSSTETDHCAGLAEFPDSTCTVQGNGTRVESISGTSCNGTSLLTSSASYLRQGQELSEVQDYTDGTNPPSSGSPARCLGTTASTGGLLTWVLLLLLGFGFLDGALAVIFSPDVINLPAFPTTDTSAYNPDPEMQHLEILDRRDLIEMRQFEPEGFLKYILNLVSKFGQRSSKEIFSDITESDAPEKCTLLLSPKQPWYKELTHQSMQTVCTAIGDAISSSTSFSDWLKSKVMVLAAIKSAEKSCVAAVRTFILTINVDVAAIYLVSPPTLAIELAVYLLADVVCKATISAITQISVGGTLEDVCKAVGDKLLPWPDEITEKDGLPCRDEGIPTTPNVVPAVPPPEVVNPPNGTDATNTTGAVLDFAQLTKLWDTMPCTAHGVLYYINDLRSGNHIDTRPYNRMLSPPLCASVVAHHNPPEDPSWLCKQTCRAACVSYEDDVVDPFVNHFTRDEFTKWYDERSIGSKCDLATMQMGLANRCPSSPAFDANCRGDDDW